MKIINKLAARWLTKFFVLIQSRYQLTRILNTCMWDFAKRVSIKDALNQNKVVFWPLAKLICFDPEQVSADALIKTNASIHQATKK